MATDDDRGGGTPSLAARSLRMSAGRRLMACTSASISATPGVAPAGAVPVALPSVSAPPAGAPPVLRGIQSELTTGSYPVRGWHARVSLCVRPWPTRGLAPHAQVWYTQGNSSKSPEPHTLQGIRSLKSSHARADVDAPGQAAVSLAPTATCGANTRKLRRKLAAKLRPLVEITRTLSSRSEC